MIARYSNIAFEAQQEGKIKAQRGNCDPYVCDEQKFFDRYHKLINYIWKGIRSGNEEACSFKGRLFYIWPVVFDMDQAADQSVGRGSPRP